MSWTDDLERDLVAAAARRPRVRARRLAARAATAAGVLALGAGVAVGAVGGSSSTSDPAAPATQRTTVATTPHGDTTVAVLNGTTTPGLARDVANRLQRRGWKIGVVTNAPTHDIERTGAGYAPGHEDEARVVLDALGLLGVEPHAVDRGVPAVAGDADVSIVIGRDLVRGVPKVRSYPLRDRAGKAVGTVDVARGAISVRAAGLPPSKVYALWLGRRFLGFFPPVTKDRPLDGHAAVDRAAGELLVTREDGGDRPRRPGTVVLRATLR